MCKSLFAFACAIVALICSTTLASAQQSTAATITSSKLTLADLPGGQQPAGTKGIRVDGQFDCGFGKAAPPGQPDTIAQISIAVSQIVQNPNNPKQSTVTLIDTEDITTLAGRTGTYSSKRFNLPILDAQGQPAKYRVDVYLYITGQPAPSAATSFVPDFTL